MKKILWIWTVWTLSAVPLARAQTCSGVQTFSLPTGTISDGSGAGLYSHNLNCGFLIQVAGAESYTLTFTEFDVQNGADKLIVYRGAGPYAEVETVLTGTQLPGALTVHSSAVYLRFVTDGSVAGQGWHLNYAVNNPPSGPTCGGTTLVFPATGTVNDGSGSGNYSPNLDCRWILTPSGAKTITLTFKEFDVEPGNDVVEIYSGDVENPANLLASYSGSALPPSVSTQGNPAKMLVVFRTNASVEAGGFVFDYFSSSGFCAGPSLLTAPSGTVTDGSGPLNYANNAHCAWRIQPQAAPDRIRITFTAFNTQLNADFVRVYAGADATGMLLGTFSGANLPAPIVVTGPSAYVLFTSNPTTTRPGWSFNYNTEYNPCSPPSNLQAAVSDNAAQLTWNPHGGSSAPYQLTITGQGGYVHTLYLPFGTTQYIATNLPAGREYTATLTALCAPDQPLTVGFETECPPASIPVLDVFTLSENYAAFYWPIHPDVPAYYYELRMHDVLLTSGSVATGFVEFTGLEAGTDYEFRLYHQCYNGLSSNYGVATFSTPCPSPGGLTLNAVSETQASVEWNDVPGAVQYAWTLNDYHGGQTSGIATGTAVDFNDLIPGSNYTISVITECANGSSSAVSALSFSTLCPAVANVQILNLGAYSAEVGWQTLFGQNTVHVRVTGSEGTVFDGPVSVEQLALSGLTPGSVYSVEIQTLCRDFGSPPVVVDFVTLCPAPESGAVPVGVYEATASWSAVPGVNTFNLYLNGTFIETVSALEYLLTGLEPGTDYLFEVATACNETQSNALSLSFQTVCPTTDHVSVQAAGTDFVTLNIQPWAGVQGYRIVATALNGGQNVEQTYSPAPDDLYTLVGLTSGEYYSVEIYTLCNHSQSDPYVLTASTPCVAQTGLEVGDVTTTSAVAVWDDISPNGYRVEFDGETLDVFEPTLTLTGLAPGTTYVLSVAPVCIGGVVGEPAVVSFNTLCPTVSGLVVSNLTSTSALLTWDEIPGAEYVVFLYDWDMNPVETSIVFLNAYEFSGLIPGGPYTALIYTYCPGSDEYALDYAEATFDLICPQIVFAAQTGLQETTVEVEFDDLPTANQYVLRLYWNDEPYGTLLTPYLPPFVFDELIPGEDYRLEITAVCPQFVESAPYVMTVSTLCPSMTVAPEVSAGADTARVMWTPLAGINDYEVEVYDAEFNLIASAVVSGASSYTFTGLAPGKSHWALVAPLCSNGAGGGIPAAFTTLCPTPEIISVEPGVTTAVVSWNDFGADCEIAVFDGFTTTNFIADASPFTLTGLAQGTNYSLRIRAMCAETQSNFSDEIFFTTLVCPAAENVEVIEVGADNAVVQWTASGLADGGYLFTVVNSTAGTTMYTAAGSPFTLTGLAPGAHYEGTIVALCGDAESSAVPFVFSTLCHAPQNLAVSPITSTTALLLWDNGPNYDGYAIIYYPAAGGETLGGTAYVNEFPLEDLLPGTDYVAEIRTVCVDFDSDVSMVEFTTLCPEPTVQFTAGESFITLQVSGEIGDVFEVLIETGDQTVVQQTVSVDPSGEYTFSGLAGGTTYTVSVSNVCTDALGTVSYEVSTLCGYPAGGEVVDFTATTATITWNVVDGVESYDLALLSTSGGPSVTGLTADDIPYTFTGLLAGTTYEVELATQCPNGPGDFQIIGVFTTPCPAPSNLTLVQASATSAEFTWTGADGVTQYLLTLEPGGIVQTFTGTTGVVSGLIPGTLYTATVISACSEFDSEPSNVVEFSTLCPDVEMVNVNDITATTGAVSWPASAGAASYNVELENIDAGTSQLFVEITDIFLFLTDLTPNTSYRVWVYANCEGGESSINPATATFQTLCAPFDLTATASDDAPCLDSPVELSVAQSLIDAGFDPMDFAVTWQPGALTGVSVTVYPDITQTYTAVAVRDGCEYTATLALTLPTRASVSTENLCVVLGQTGTVEVFDAPSFRVEPEDGVTIVGNVANITPTETGMYHFIVTDVHSCEQTLVVNVYVNEPADFNLTDGQHIYACESPLELEGTPSGGTFTTFPDGLLTGQTLDPGTAVPGAYTVTYTYVGDGGCEVSHSVTITVGVNPVAVIDPIDADGVLCSYQTGPFALEATPPGGMFSGDGVTGDVFTPAGPGEYVISYEATVGECTFAASITMTVLPPLGASVMTTYSTGGANGSITAEAFGGLPPYEYSLDGVNYQLHGTFENLNAGNYTVYVRDAAGCETTIAAIVEVCSVPQFSLAVPSSTSVVVSWTNMVPSLPYSVRYRPVGNPVFQIRTNINTTSVNLTGLTPATTYEGQILSACGAESEFFAFSTLAGGGCSIPTGLSAGYVASTTALVTWNPVGAATSYILRWRPVGGTFYTQTIVNAPITSHLITGLGVGTTYEISIRSRCGTISTTFSSPIPYLHTPPSREALVSDESPISVYPNPSKGEFTLRFHDVGEQQARVVVSDMFGKPVYRKAFVTTFGENQLTEAIQAPPGVYVVTLLVGQARHAVKWILE